MNKPSQPLKRKPGRPKLQNSETKTKILRTAALLFMEIGYEKVSLEIVAKSSGITKASVYYYFQNKASLFTACLTYMLTIAYEATMNIMQEPINLKDKLRKIALKQMQNEHLDFETMMRDASKELTEHQSSEIRQAEAKLKDALIAAFEQAIKEGEVSAQHSPIVLAHLYSSLLTMKNHLPLRTMPLEQLVDEMIQIFWYGAIGKQN